jgi:hypothetical protein
MDAKIDELLAGARMRTIFVIPSLSCADTKEHLLRRGEAVSILEQQVSDQQDFDRLRFICVFICS